MENIKSLEDALQNPDLKETVQVDNKLKDFIVDFTGQQLNPENSEVTVEMVIEVLASHFPEVAFALAEENFLRGYEQALSDVDAITKDDISKPEYSVEEYHEWRKKINE